MASQQEIAAMRRALELARNPDVPLGPNPRVGAVVLGPDGSLVAEGYHRGAGSAHAEVGALARAGSAARGSTLVVTLEPCNHSGRTGPCAQALIDAGVSRVVYGQPDGSVAARGGARALVEAGVVVEPNVLGDEAAEVNPRWTSALRHRRPFVTWKFAATLDGRSAALDGSSRWITGEPARADVHRRRAECDTILVGTGTVLRDDPGLTVRSAQGPSLPPDRQPLRVVMGHRALPPRARVLDDDAETLHLRSHDITLALRELYCRGRHHVWLEGGPTLAAALVAAGLVDEVVAYLAPALLGSGPAAVGDLGGAGIHDIHRFTLVGVAQLGDDVRLVLGTPTTTSASGVDH